MCGISGIINKTNKKVSKKEIKIINDLIAHRGPDDEGFFFEKNFAFGHRRLSILDLSLDGHQPMHYLDKYVITYNGEIYNYIEIKEKLINYGYKFKSNTDTEVILASYDKWGTDCVNKFNGMWAFAIYDKEKNIIFCSRDRFGIKPFYYTELDNKFIFGSEIKQLLEYFPIKYLNINIALDYLTFGLEDHTNETFFKDIFKLDPSHNLIYDLNTDSYKKIKYYDIIENKNFMKLNLEEAIKTYKESFIKSINLRLRSDVKVGACLSGGLDSSSIVAIASKEYFNKTKNKFIAIHAKSIENKTDESRYAKAVSDYCNVDLKIIEPNTNEFIKVLDEVIVTHEEPFGSPSIFMQYFVFKKANKLGCKVMLDGQGGDETLLGYEHYFQVYLANYFINFKFLKIIKFLKDINSFKISKVKILLQTILTIFWKIRYKRIIKATVVKQEFLESKRIKQILKINYKNILQFQKNNIFQVGLPHLLKYEDKNSMKHSIESRLPFLDVKNVELSLNINPDYKIYNGYLKYLLRKVIERKLPYEIVWRKNKFGFEAPENIWLDSIKNEMMKDINESEIIKKFIESKKVNKDIDNKILWRLYNMARWEKLYKVSI